VARIYSSSYPFLTMPIPTKPQHWEKLIDIVKGGIITGQNMKYLYNMSIPIGVGVFLMRESDFMCMHHNIPPK